MSNLCLDIIFSGMQFSGKGKQAGILQACHQGVMNFSSGDFFRKIAQNDHESVVAVLKNMPLCKPDDLVATIRNASNGGVLVPDTYLQSIIRHCLEEAEKKQATICLWDGFCRTFNQSADLFERVRARRKGKVNKIVLIDLFFSDPQDYWDRLSKRVKDQGRKDDLDLDAVNRRIQIFNNNHLGTLSFWEQRAIMHPTTVSVERINASRAPHEVSVDVHNAVGLSLPESDLLVQVAA